MRYVSVCTDWFRDYLKNSMRGPADLATRIGVVLLTLMACLMVSNITAPPPYGWNANTGLPAMNGGMDLLQRPLSTPAYLLILVGCAGWIQIRFHATFPQCGWAAAKITFLASLPTISASLLILSGVLGVVVLAPGEAPAASHFHGFALTYYNPEHQLPGAWELLLWAAMRVPESFCLGVVGGLIGRGMGLPRRSSPQPA